MNSNPDLVLLFIILIMRHWKGQVAVKCLNQAKHTQTWCDKCVWVKPNLSPLMTQKQVVVTMLDTEFQSQPSLTIHHTNDETLDGSSCYQFLESTQTHSILVQKV